MTTIMEPAVLEAIEAEYFAAVYRAARRARLQLVGLAEPPRPTSAALALFRRAGRPRLAVIK